MNHTQERTQMKRFYGGFNLKFLYQFSEAVYNFNSRRENTIQLWMNSDKCQFMNDATFTLYLSAGTNSTPWYGESF